jgi:hypothetical protein
MYTNLDLFFRAQYLAFCKTQFSLRRWAYLIFFTMLYWLMWIVVAFGRLLDRLLFWSFLRQEVREPPCDPYYFSTSCQTPFQSLPGGFRRKVWMR